MDFPKSVPGVGLVNGKFIDEDPLAATPGSLIPSVWGNSVTQEILNVISSTGVAPDEANTGQLLTAIDKKIEGSTVSFATQAEAEAGTVATKAMSPLRVFQAIAKVVTQATEAKFGWLKLSTQTQTNNGIDDATAVTPKKLASTVQSQAYLAVTTTGTGTAYAIAPNYDAAPYAANQRFCVTFHVASGVNPTINASGRGNRGLKQYDYTGAKVAAVIKAGQISDIIFDGADFVVINRIHESPLVDVWALQPIGALVGLLDNGAVQAPPSGSSAYTYIRLTASDSYNAPYLTGESVSGTQPLLLASAVVSLAESVFNGVTVRLINTERRVLRAGLPGVVEQDALQGHFHNVYAGNTAGTGLTSGTVTGGNALVNDTVPGGGRVQSPASDGVNGTVRTAIETRVKSMGVTYYMRIK